MLIETWGYFCWKPPRYLNRDICVQKSEGCQPNHPVLTSWFSFPHETFLQKEPIYQIHPQQLGRGGCSVLEVFTLTSKGGGVHQSNLFGVALKTWRIQRDRTHPMISNTAKIHKALWRRVVDHCDPFIRPYFLGRVAFGVSLVMFFRIRVGSASLKPPESNEQKTVLHSSKL